MSILIFIIIGLLVGEAATLFFERKYLVSIRYMLTALALSTAVGMVITLLIKGVSGFGELTNAAIIFSFLAATGGVLMLKLSAPQLNDKTDADVPWNADLDSDDEEAEDEEQEDESKPDKQTEKEQKERASGSAEEEKKVEEEDEELYGSNKEDSK